MKNERQIAIASIITTNSIEKQEELIELLREAGFDAAQATVSRDLRQMNIVKVADGKGGLRYSMPPSESSSGFDQYNKAFLSSVKSVDFSMNNVVIKTHNGMANAVAVGLDSIDLPQILGCVAGDDTIIMVTRTTEDAQYIAENIHNIMNRQNAVR